MNPLDTPARNLLGCRHPFVLAGMGGVARSELVAAVTAAGGFGFLGMVRESPELIRREVEELRRLGHQRFGVNLIPAATPPALLEVELQACIDLAVPMVCLFWDIDPGIVRRLRDAGIMVAYQIGSADEARAAEAAGAQLIIAQGVEAGGHVRGTRPLRQLLPEVAAAVAAPVLAAGGIADGADAVVAMGLGAQGVVIGTAMIPTLESFAHDFHKERLLAAGGGDTVLTRAFHINWPDGAAVRVLKSDVTAGLRGDPEAPGRTVIGWEGGRPVYLFSTDSPLRSITGEFGAMPLYAGKGVGRVSSMMAAGARLAKMLDGARELLQPPAGATSSETSSPVCYAAEANPEYMGYLGPAALAERLFDLQALARTSLVEAAEAAPASGTRSPELLRWARWAVLLGACAAGRGTASRSVDGRAPAGADSPASLTEGARRLLPLVMDDEVRGLLVALLGEFGERGEEDAPLQLWRNGRMVLG